MFLCIPHLCSLSPYFVFPHSVLRSADISIHFTVTPLNLLLLYIYADSEGKAFIFCQRFQKLPFFLFQHRNVVLKKYYFILSYLKKYLHRKKAAHMCCQIMPFVGLTPFLPDTEFGTDLINKMCVNALHRAYSISTVPSRNTHKMGAQFRHNYR